MKFELGSEVKDKNTGFVGIVTARAQYLHGDTRYEVTPKSVEGQKSDDPRWIDEGRLEQQ